MGYKTLYSSLKEELLATQKARLEKLKKDLREGASPNTGVYHAGVLEGIDIALAKLEDQWQLFKEKTNEDDDDGETVNI